MRKGYPGSPRGGCKRRPRDAPAHLNCADVSIGPKHKKLRGYSKSRALFWGAFAIQPQYGGAPCG